MGGSGIDGGGGGGESKCKGGGGGLGGARGQGGMGAGDFVEGDGKQCDVGGYSIIEVEWRGGAMGKERLLVGGGEVDEGRP